MVVKIVGVDVLLQREKLVEVALGDRDCSSPGRCCEDGGEVVRLYGVVVVLR